MTPDVVVDIGNSRMKWGVCSRGRVEKVLRIPLDECAAWEAELARISPPQFSDRQWAVASVNPPALQRFLQWTSSRGRVAVFENHTELPIVVNVDEPSTVGLDRLFGAVAAKTMVPPGTPAITVDVGTAVTVNLIDAEGVFQGGAIFPGPRLMGRALHEFTAKLPLIDLTVPVDDLWGPGKNTAEAIRLGIDAAVGAGAAQLVHLFADGGRGLPFVFITGGGGHLIPGSRFALAADVRHVPALILEGIRIAAEALP